MQLNEIRLQKLFLVAIVVKTVSSFVGWRFQLPWSFGFWIPIGVMAAYVIIGLKRRDTDVSDEKFADSCYYLGFIFTITSIIFSLFDLPSIGTRIQDIAVRFGAAMVSTVAGLVVRVYLVSFRKDANDALRESEDALIEASSRLREQLVLSLERMRAFESQVDSATRSSVERVNLQVERMSHEYSERLGSYLKQLASVHQDASSKALADIKDASQRLVSSVDSYSVSMASQLSGIGTGVEALISGVETRLNATTFPDDFFVARLSKPAVLLEEATTEVSAQVRLAAEEIAGATQALAAVLRQFRNKSGMTETALDKVLSLTAQQQEVLNSAGAQVGAMTKIGNSLAQLQGILDGTTYSLTSSTAANKELSLRVEALALEGAANSQRQLELFGSILGRVAESVEVTRNLAQDVKAGLQAQTDSLTKFLSMAVDISSAGSNTVVTAITPRTPVSTHVGIEPQAIATRSAVGDSGDRPKT
jgi:hypothetical protein